MEFKKQKKVLYFRIVHISTSGWQIIQKYVPQGSEEQLASYC